MGSFRSSGFSIIISGAPRGQPQHGLALEHKRAERASHLMGHQPLHERVDGVKDGLSHTEDATQAASKRSSPHRLIKLGGIAQPTALHGGPGVGEVMRIPYDS